MPHCLKPRRVNGAIPRKTDDVWFRPLNGPVGDISDGS